MHCESFELNKNERLKIRCIASWLLIEASLSEPHTYQYYKKKRVPMYVCTHVDMYVAIRRPCAHHASALHAFSIRTPKLQAGKDQWIQRNVLTLDIAHQSYCKIHGL